MTEAVLGVPAHIPRDLVFDFDMNNPPGADRDVHLAWKRLHDEAPDIFWTPRNGGHWVATRADDIEVMQLDYARFSHHRVQIPKPPEDQPIMIPLELDPPEHTPFRALLSPAFGPRKVREMEADVRALIRNLIDEVYDLGECDFFVEIAQRFPIGIFLRLVDLPFGDREELLGYTDMFVRARTEEQRTGAHLALGRYVEKYIIERRAKPGPDLFSQIVNATVNGRPYTPNETMGMLMVVLFGGLDTVASAMGFIVKSLIEYPSVREQIVAEPSLIPVAVEEMLRRNGIPNTARLITGDFDYNGVPFRKNDSILLPKVLFGLDERRFPDPLAIRLDRGPIRHAAFGAGPHHCAGTNLARMELRVFLEEWLKRIPEFSVKPGARIVTTSGSVNGMASLPIAWPVQ